jgi:hypothetical protein
MADEEKNTAKPAPDKNTDEQSRKAEWARKMAGVNDDVSDAVAKPNGADTKPAPPTAPAIPLAGQIAFSADEVAHLLKTGTITTPIWSAVSTALWDLLEASWFTPRPPTTAEPPT